MEKQTPRQPPASFKTQCSVSKGRPSLSPSLTQQIASALTNRVLAARAELAANGVVHCLPGDLSEVYRKD